MRPLAFHPLLPLIVTMGILAPGAAFADRACNDKCDAQLSYCLQQGTASQTCRDAYFDCTGKCFFGGVDTPVSAPAAGRFDFAPIYPGQVVTWTWRYGNRWNRRSTLYMSFSPPISSDLGFHSAGPVGPWSFSFGNRWELNKGEGQNVQLQFAPTEIGTFKATVYWWWDSASNFGWENIINFYGTTVAPPPPAAPPPVSPGGSGGTESLPSWMFANGERYQPQFWMQSDAEAAAGRRRPVGAPGGAIQLRQLMPDTLAGMTPLFVTPEGVIGGSNATDSLAANYKDRVTGGLRAVVLAMRTRRDVYSHVYAVCSRVKGGWLESIAFPSVAVPGSAAPATFWQSSLITEEGGPTPSREIASGFAVYISPDAHQFTVDSHWLAEQYATGPGDVVTFQVWSSDEATTAVARNAVLDGFRRLGTLTYQNTQTVPAPQLFIASADYGSDSTQLITINNSGSDRTVDFDSVTWTAASSASEQRDRVTRTIKAGRDTIALPMPGRLNGVVYMNEPGSSWTDEVYFADGNWFSYSESAAPPWSTPDCPALPLGPGDLAVAGCGLLTGAVELSGYRGLGRSVATYTRPVLDVHAMRAIRFLAKGPEETAEVRVTSKSVDGHFIAHGAYFTPSPAGRQISIPFSALLGRDDARGTPFGGDRVVQITWNVIGSPHGATDLTIGAVSFSPDSFVEGAPFAISTSDTAGPYFAAGRIDSRLDSPTATLNWRRRGSTQFIRVPAASQADLVYAGIPGQPVGSVVEWYIELTDATGRLAANPPDAPYELNTFTVSERPVIRIDDFDDRSLRNERDGAEATFRNGGASVALDHDQATLHLSWDVHQEGSFSGWVSSFERPIDGSGLDALVFRIRGAAGGERLKVGLGDRSGAEHKVVVAKFLDGGISTGWRDVLIPLAVFTTIDRTAIAKALFVFENGIGSGSGSVEVDDLALKSTGSITSIPVESFDDGTNEDAFGGSFSTATGGSATLGASPSAGAFHLSAHGDAASWAALAFDVRGFDARAMSRLGMSIRGLHGGESPHVYLVSIVPGQMVRQWVDVRSYVTVATTWQRLSIPLADFASHGVDLQNVARIEVVWEWQNFDEVIDIDNLAFDLSP